MYFKVSVYIKRKEVVVVRNNHKVCGRRHKLLRAGWSSTLRCSSTKQTQDGCNTYKFSISRHTALPSPINDHIINLANATESYIVMNRFINFIDYIFDA